MIHLADGRIVALRTRSLNDQERDPFARARRVKAERHAAYWAAMAAMPPRNWPASRLNAPGRFVVILTRVAPTTSKQLDEHDNLPGSLKHVVDGICERLEVDDGNRARIRFEYRQEIGPWAVLFTVALEPLVPALAQNSGETAREP